MPVIEEYADKEDEKPVFFIVANEPKK